MKKKILDANILIELFNANCKEILIKSAGWDQTTLILKRLLERGLFSQGFGSGVDHFVPDLNVFRPMRNQSPAKQLSFVSRLIWDGQDVLRRSDIKPGFMVRAELHPGKRFFQLR